MSNCGLGAFEQCLCIDDRRRECWHETRDAEARGDRERPAGDVGIVGRAFEHGAHALGEHTRTRLGRGRREDGEGLVLETRDDIDLTRASQQRRRGGLQDAIASRTFERREAIEIERDHGEGLTVAIGPLDFLGESLLEVTAIHQPGERVVHEATSHLGVFARESDRLRFETADLTQRMHRRTHTRYEFDRRDRSRRDLAGAEEHGLFREIRVVDQRHQRRSLLAGPLAQFAQCRRGGGIAQRRPDDHDVGRVPFDVRTHAREIVVGRNVHARIAKRERHRFDFATHRRQCDDPNALAFARDGDAVQLHAAECAPRSPPPVRSGPLQGRWIGTHDEHDERGVGAVNYSKFRPKAPIVVGTARPLRVLRSASRERPPRYGARVKPVRLDDLIACHAAIFLDAYGVLVDAEGAIDGALDAIARLERARTNWFVMTNDASRTPASMVARFAGLGLAIPAERIVAPMDVLPRFLDERGARGARTVVLGQSDSHAMVRAAGASLVDPMETLDFDVLVLADQTGFPMLETFDRVVSGLLRALDVGREPLLVLPNPDRIYPKRRGEFGVASGSLAALIEAALAARVGDQRARTFECIGKPYAPIFAEACRRAGTNDAVLIGDQLITDVRGANAFGIASALVGTGVTRVGEDHRVDVREDVPTYVMRDLR